MKKKKLFENVNGNAFKLNESYYVYVKGAEEYPDLTTILNIIFAISRKALKPLENLTAEEKSVFDKQRMPEILSPDGNDFDKPTGIINFYVAGIPENRIKEILENVREQLDNLNVVYGTFKVDKSKMLKSNVIRIPILKNDNKYQGPPEMNVSNFSARILFHDMLGFEDQGQYYSMPIDQLEKSLAEWNDLSDEEMMQKLEKHTSPASIEKDGGATIISGGWDYDRLYNYISQLNDIVKWAKDHGYKYISAS